MAEIKSPPGWRQGRQRGGDAPRQRFPRPREQDIVFEHEDAGKALGDGVRRDRAMRLPDGAIGVAPAHGPIEQNLTTEAERMELRGSLGGSVRLLLQRDAVDGGETGSERRHASSTGAIVAPLVARQGLEIRV